MPNDNSYAFISSTVSYVHRNVRAGKWVGASAIGRAFRKRYWTEQSTYLLNRFLPDGSNILTHASVSDEQPASISSGGGSVVMELVEAQQRFVGSPLALKGHREEVGSWGGR